MVFLETVVIPVYCLQLPLYQEDSKPKPLLGYGSEIWLPLESDPCHLSSKILFLGPQSSSFWLSITKGFIPFSNDFFLNNCFIAHYKGLPLETHKYLFFLLEYSSAKPRHYKHKCLFSFPEKRGMVLATLIFPWCFPTFEKLTKGLIYVSCLAEGGEQQSQSSVQTINSCGSVGFKF